MGIKVASGFERQAAIPLDEGSIVADLTARDAIVAGVRYEGMVVYVVSEGANFQLIGGTDNANWEDFGSGGGSGGGVVELKPNDSTASPTLVQSNPIEHWKYSDESEFLWGRDVVPANYKAGDKINLELGKCFVNSDTTSEKVYFQLTAYLFKPNDDMTSLSNASGWWPSVSSATLNTTNGMLSVKVEVGSAGLVSTNGTVGGDGVAIAAEDFIVFKLGILKDASETDEYQGDINLVDKTFRLNFKGE